MVSHFSFNWTVNQCNRYLLKLAEKGMRTVHKRSFWPMVGKKLVTWLPTV